MRWMGHWTAPPHPPTWAWNGHKVHTAGTGGSYHLAHWPHAHSRWLALAPDGSRSWGILTRVCVQMCVVWKKGLTIGIGLSPGILSFVSSPKTTYWDCVYVCKCVCHSECLLIVNVQQCLNVQKWQRELAKLLECPSADCFPPQTEVA